MREKPKCGNFLGKAGNGKTKIVDFSSPMGRISILKAVLESVHHADLFEPKQDILSFKKLFFYFLPTAGPVHEL